MNTPSFSYPWTGNPIKTVSPEDRPRFNQVSEVTSSPACHHSPSQPRTRQFLGTRPNRFVTLQKSSDDPTAEPLEQLTGDHVELVHRQNDSHLPQWQGRPARTQVSATHLRNVRPRPHIGAGLPTSYDHSRNRSLSSSSSDTSYSPRLFPRALKFDHSSPSSTTMAETRTGEKRASLPGLSPSPSLIFVDLKDWPRPHFRSHQKVGSHSSVSSTGTFVGSGVVREASDGAGGHSRASSQSFSVHNASSATEPISITAAMVDEERRGRFGRGKHGDHLPANHRARYQTISSGVPADPRLRRFSMSQSHPNLPAAVAAHPSASEQHNSSLRQEGPSIQHSARPSQAPLVTAELVSTPHYLEPYNSCEAIMLPRPRLRSRSLDNGPSIVVERVHALPERFMQISETQPDGDGTRLVPRSSMMESRERHHDVPRIRSDTQLGSLQPPKKDPRLSLHANIPPPLPPRDSPLPSSGLLPLRSLPATPRPPTPEPEPARHSSESLEQLEAPELLQRNLQLERDREAWREQHRTSLGANIGPMIGRLSPYLRVPSPVPFPPAGQQTEPAMRGDDASPIQVHRLRNHDGAEQTLLVVQQAGHPYAQRAPSISSPDLPRGQSEGKHRMHRLSLLTQKLGGLTSRRRSATQRGEAPTSRIDQQAAGTSAADVGRPIGRGRRLVTDETVVIGRLPEPVRKDEAVQTDPWNGHVTEEVQLGEAVSGPAAPVTYPSSASRYRPAGTRDEIKAQLGEHLPWLARRSFRMGATEVSEDRVTWYDPGSSSVLRGRAIPPGLPRELHSVDTEQEAFPSASSSESSIATSRSNSDHSPLSGEHGPTPPGPGACNDAGRGRRPMEGLTGGGAQLAGHSEPAVRTPTADLHSSVSDRDTALWEAGSVDVEDLFFRLPRRGVS